MRKAEKEYKRQMNFSIKKYRKEFRKKMRNMILKHFGISLITKMGNVDKIIVYQQSPFLI